MRLVKKATQNVTVNVPFIINSASQLEIIFLMNDYLLNSRQVYATILA